MSEEHNKTELLNNRKIITVDDLPEYDLKGLTATKSFSPTHYLRHFYTESQDALGPSSDDILKSLEDAFKENHNSHYSHQYLSYLMIHLPIYLDNDTHNNNFLDQFTDIVEIIYNKYLKEKNYDTSEISIAYLKYYLKEVGESMGPSSDDIYYEIVEEYEKKFGVSVPDKYRNQYGE